MAGDNSKDSFALGSCWPYASAQKVAAIVEEAPQREQPLGFNQVRIQDMRLEGLDDKATHHSKRREFAFNASTKPSKHAYKLRINSRDGSLSPRNVT